MKRSLVFLGVLALALGLTGCVKARMETTLNADGSGVFSMNAAVSQGVADALKELDELGGMEGMDDAPSMNIEKAKLEAACEEHDVTIKKFEDSDKSGRMIDLVLEFKDIEGLNAVLAAGMEDAKGFSLVKTADGDYILRGDEDLGSEEDETASDETEGEDEADSAEEMDPAKMGKTMEIMGKLMSSMSELDVIMRITVPGDIIESTAPETEGRTAIWAVNSENMMTTDMGDPQVTFSGKGLDLEADPEE